MDCFLKTILFSFVLASIFASFYAQECSMYGLDNNNTYASCVMLPVQSSFLYWTYHQTNHTADIAYRMVRVTSSQWVCWALNPYGRGMVGSQCLLAYTNSVGLIQFYTTQVLSYVPAMQQSGLNFTVRGLTAERRGGDMIIYATLHLPIGRTRFTHLWQVGPVSGDTLNPHDLNPVSINSIGTLDFSPGKTTPDKKFPLVQVLAPSLSIGLLILFFVGCSYKIIKNSKSKEEDGDDDVMGTLQRFSFLELKSATEDFRLKLGQGGFGSVFKGKLSDGANVAVKLLDSIGQGRKEFLAEVNTLGSIHHFNLVKLVGYCVEKSNRLLVYEHMSNGSLDKWIFNQEPAQTLSWEIRRKIIVELAKGLEYLHIHCNPNIIHFDIKPQNILLDADFNAKISDFGLAKLIDRDQSQVLTALKGTPGYVAPELFHGTHISVKADVFSFGIVVLEIILGRKNSSKFGPLINLVKAEKDELHDVLDKNMQSHKEEAVKMIRVAVRCLQSHNRRPHMSTVLKVLEGSVDLDLECVEDQSDLTMQETLDAQFLSNSTPSSGESLPVASILSGPR